MLTSSFVRQIFFGALRHFATAGGGWLMAHGLLTNNQLNGWTGCVFFLGGILWSAWDKWEHEGRV